MNKSKRKAQSRKLKRDLSRFLKLKRLQMRVVGFEETYDERYSYRRRASRRTLLESRRRR